MLATQKSQRTKSDGNNGYGERMTISKRIGIVDILTLAMWNARGLDYEAM